MKPIKSLKDLETIRIDSRYKRLGNTQTQGNYGEVFKAEVINGAKGSYVAVKLISLNAGDEEIKKKYH